MPQMAAFNWLFWGLVFFACIYLTMAKLYYVK